MNKRTTLYILTTQLKLHHQSLIIIISTSSVPDNFQKDFSMLMQTLPWERLGHHASSIEVSTNLFKINDTDSHTFPNLLLQLRFKISTFLQHSHIINMDNHVPLEVETQTSEHTCYLLTNHLTSHWFHSIATRLNECLPLAKSNHHCVFYAHNYPVHENLVI